MGLQKHNKRHIVKKTQQTHKDSMSKFSRSCKNLSYHSHRNNCCKYVSKLQENLTMAFKKKSVGGGICLLSYQRNKD